MSPVVQWFGEAFKKLHPLIQELHSVGGNLSGIVNIEFGTGIAGVIGRRLANKLGMPTHQGPSQLEVSIFHDNNALHWVRMFNGKYKVASVFVPHGSYPDGYCYSGCLVPQIKSA